MAKTIFDKDNTELDGTDEVVEQNVTTTLEGDTTLFHYYNGTNVSVDATLVGSAAQDSDFSKGIQLDSATISSGGNADFYVVSDPWETVELTLSFGGDPTSGSVQVYRMGEQ